MLTITYSPAEVAARHGCKVDKVLSWINSKQLIAINAAASRTAKKPRWRIRPEDLEAFERARTTAPKVATVQRRKRAAAPVKSYF